MRAAMMRGGAIVEDEVPDPQPRAGRALGIGFSHDFPGGYAERMLLTGQLRLPPGVIFECVGIPGVIDRMMVVERHAKILVEPWRR